MTDEEIKIEDYEIDYDFVCPRCGQSPIYYRDCMGWCDGGLIDMSENDPINYAPGSFRICTDCWGTGIEQWCPSCGLDIAGYFYRQPAHSDGR